MSLSRFIGIPFPIVDASATRASTRDHLIDWFDLVALTRRKFADRRERRRVKAAVRTLKARWAEDMDAAA